MFDSFWLNFLADFLTASQHPTRVTLRFQEVQPKEAVINDETHSRRSGLYAVDIEAVVRHEQFKTLFTTMDKQPSLRQSKDYLRD
jgi:hypothetical protein